MIEYPKIHTMFKRNMQGDKRIIEGDWAREELAYLQDAHWLFSEKVDGTNIRIEWNGKEPIYGGRTDNAQIPNGVINRLNDLFYSTLARQKLKEIFPEATPDTPITLFGEGYGAKIQSGGKYKSEQDFVLFDIFIGSLWLKREAIEDVAGKLGLDVVPLIGMGTLHEAIALVKNGLISQWGDFEAEGIVARPSTELLTRRRERIITKIKAVDFK